MNIIPSFNEFKKKIKKGNLVPVFTEIFADMETPVSAFKKLEGKYSFLLESVEGGEKIARYSFLGTNPAFVFKAKDGFSTHNKDPLELLKDKMQNFKIVESSKLTPFVGGAVGFISYDIIRYFEDIKLNNPDDLNLPDIFLMFTDTLVIFDHIRHTIKVVATVNTDLEKNVTKSYANAIKKIRNIVSKLLKPSKTRLLTNKECEPIKLSSNISKDEFKKMVLKAKEYIKAGDIIQTVLSQRLSANIKINSFDIYRALRIVNPSPYMYYLKFNELRIIGASPELMVRVEDGTVTSRPIAGTRKRGKSDEEDKKLIKELLNDPKEKAEHIMLVDLARNDLGRICDYKSVKVSELMTIEKYSHVMHIVSNVCGKLCKDKDIYDVIRASFPAGTVSGAPKIRAIEIIEELEKVRRGPYAGLIGYFSYSGNLDSCITIRTIVVKKDTIYIQAGAGIVADSKPEKEYYETLNKAKALISAINIARRGFQNDFNDR